MKIAVTGAGGSIADRLIESFHLGEGPSLAAVATHPSALTLAARFAIDLRVADPLDPDSLARSFTGCSALVHTAEPTGGDAKRSATAVCRAATLAGLRRIVWLSTADVHGLAPKTGTDERSAPPLDELDPAAALAAAGERHFLTEARKAGVASCVLRPALVYGPRTPLLFDLASAWAEGRAALLGRGDGVCNVAFIDNVVAAIRLALRPRAPSGTVFLVSDAETISWRRFFETAAAELGFPLQRLQTVAEPPAAPARPSRSCDEPGFRRDAPPEREPAAPDLAATLLSRQRCRWKLPHERARRDLGYEPPVPFDIGMKRTAAWWRFTLGEVTAAA